MPVSVSIIYQCTRVVRPLRSRRGRSSDRNRNNKSGRVYCTIGIRYRQQQSLKPLKSRVVKKSRRDRHASHLPLHLLHSSRSTVRFVSFSESDYDKENYYREVSQMIEGATAAITTHNNNYTENAVNIKSSSSWKETLDNVVPAVVVLRVVSTRPFDTESAGSSYATGFVVDKQRGLILTNRHVVKPGPITTDAVFFNREEVPVLPVYRDPIHDFGFLRFDVTKLQFMRLEEVPLKPEKAQVGLDVRVVGNDSGEKLSILAGTIARLDRDAPHYSKSGYNDFNTFYLQAASGTKGGSSGSPVIDIDGNAVGLNAGSKTKSASAFFLPLHRVVRALRLLQSSLSIISKGVCLHSSDENGKSSISPGLRDPPIEPFEIPRGTIRTTFYYKGFDEARRLGLTQEMEALVRSIRGENEIGMLVVEIVVPKGEADGFLYPGDVLFKLNGKITTTFLELEDILDKSIGQSLNVSIVRAGKEIELSIPVGDLHACTPSSFLQMAGGVIHSLSYQQARNFLAPCGLVYVAEPGFVLSRAGVPKHAIISSLNASKTNSIEDFCCVLQTLTHGQRVPLEFYVFAERHRTETVVMQNDTKWYGEPIVWKRNDSSGLWDSASIYETYKEVIDLKESEIAKILKEDRNEQNNDVINTQKDDVPSEFHREAPQPTQDGKVKEPVQKVGGERIMDNVVPSLVVITAEIPPVGLSDGVHSKAFEGCGVVVHHSEKSDMGLILTDRNTVPISSCDLIVSFGAFPCEVPAVVEFLHPIHNFALISYKVSSLSANAITAVKSANLLDSFIHRGDKVHLVGLSSALQPSHRVSTVTNVAATVSIAPADVPRFRAVNADTIELDNDFGHSFSGVLANDDCVIVALWASFAKQIKGEEREFIRGIPSQLMARWVDKMILKVERRMGGSTDTSNSNTVDKLNVPVLDIEFEPVQLAKAATFKLPEFWIQTLSDLESSRKQVLRVKGSVAGSQASKVLIAGDMILTIDGKPVDSFQSIEEIVAMKEMSGSGDVLKKRKRETDLIEANPTFDFKIFRSGKEMQVSIEPSLESLLGTSRLVHWAGAMLQEPHRAVRELGFLPDGNHGVYVSRWHHGSPAHRYGLFALQWITHINDQPVIDIDNFLKLVKELKHGEYVVVKLVHLNVKPKVMTLRLDNWYWPPWELLLNPETNQWERKSL